MKRKNLPVIILMGLTTTFLFAMALLNCKLFLGPAWRLLQGKFTFSQFTSRVESRYEEDIIGKNSFVNMNGWFAGAIDQTVCNEIVKMKNGMLTSTTKQVDTSSHAKECVKLKSFLNDAGIKYLYVCAPCKIDLQKQLLPEGIEDYHNENADMLLSVLREEDTDVLDLRPILSATPELVSKYFFKTDHHWNFTGAMVGTNCIANKIQETFPDVEMDFSNLDPSKWQSHELKNWFLGSRGKRVGLYYGGVDDVVYYTPDYHVNISRANSCLGRLYKGDFMEACMASNYIQKPSYFTNSLYHLYSGTSYYITRYFNEEAPNAFKILLLSDSFGTPVSAFLSTIFQEVDMIVFRGITSMAGKADYIRSLHPDIVIQLLYPLSIRGDMFFEFDTDAAFSRGENTRPTSILPNRLEVTDESGYVSVPVNLEENQSYLLRFDDMIPSSNEIEGSLIRLYDPKKEAVVNACVFDLQYAREHDGFSWLFTTSDEEAKNLEFRFYAGLSDNASGNSAVYHGVRLDAVG